MKKKTKMIFRGVPVNLGHLLVGLATFRLYVRRTTGIQTHDLAIVSPAIYEKGYLGPHS